MERVFVDMNDAGRAILNYIGSEDFEKAMSALDMSNGRNSFIAGLGMAGTIIMADCPQYIYKEEKMSD